MAARARALYLLESEPGTGGDDQIIVLYVITVRQYQRVTSRIDFGDGLCDEIYSFLFDKRADFETHFLTVTPANRDPRIGGDKLEFAGCIDERDLMFLADLRLDFVGGGHAPNPCSQYDDVCHAALL